jgi:hypothetical protein
VAKTLRRRTRKAYPFDLSSTLATKYGSTRQERRTFKKCYLPNWTEEVFTVTKRVPRRPPVYRIADYDNDELHGTSYEQEMQKVDKTDSDFYRIEQILRSRMRNKRREYFVKLLGYPEKFNSWVPAESAKDL